MPAASEPSGGPRVELSIVVPAYNEEARIPLTLSRTLDYLDRHLPASEVLVVDDGSTDNTASIVEERAAGEPRVRLLRLPRNRGKGAAVRTGMLAARGEHVLFMDADMSTPIGEVEKLFFYARRGNDVVIGSRGLADSDIRARQPLFRESMGRVFNLLVRALLFGEFRDTQCGFKLFSRQAARDLFGRQTLDGFSFDVEILLLARQAGLEVKEVPITWYHAPHSKVSPFGDSRRMFLDLLRLRLRRASARNRADS